MLSPLFLKHFEQRLLHHPSISRKYARRVIDELADHYRDLEQDLLDAGRDQLEAAKIAEERLAANPDVLLEELVRSHSRHARNFGIFRIEPLVRLAREHALSAFGLLPILAFLGVFIAAKFVGVTTYGVLVDRLHVAPMGWQFMFVVDKLFYGAAYFATPLLALAFCQLAQRAGRSIALALISCAIISLLGGMMKLDLVQCVAGNHVAYFQRYGPDAARLGVPMLVFSLHSAIRLLRGSFLLASH